MTPDLFLATAIVPAVRLLPDEMDSAEARALVLSVALQESGLRFRRQRADGPARSFAQFEKGGISGVLQHSASALHAVNLCEALSVIPSVDAVYTAIEYQDLLCAGFTRLLLWTSPLQLPGLEESAQGYRLYLETWRPGKPHPENWRSNFILAWNTVLSGHAPPPVLKT